MFSADSRIGNTDPSPTEIGDTLHALSQSSRPDRRIPPVSPLRPDRIARLVGFRFFIFAVFFQQGSRYFAVVIVATLFRFAFAVDN